MKKLLTFFAVAAVFSMSASAQDSKTSNTATTAGEASTQAMPSSDMKKQRGMQMKEKYQERMNSASPEEKARMEKRRATMKNMTPEQKAAVKKEIERHHQEMKKLGFSADAMPQIPSQSSQG